MSTRDEQELNRRDVHTVAGARFLLPKGSSFHVNCVHEIDVVTDC